MTQRRRFTTLVVLVVALGGFVWGFDAAVISRAVPFIHKYFKRTGDQGLAARPGGELSRLGWAGSSNHTWRQMHTAIRPKRSPLRPGAGSLASDPAHAAPGSVLSPQNLCPSVSICGLPLYGPAKIPDRLPTTTRPVRTASGQSRAWPKPAAG